MFKKNAIVIDPQEVFIWGLIKKAEEHNKINILDFAYTFEESLKMLKRNVDFYFVCPEFDKEENEIIRIIIDRNLNKNSVILINNLSLTHIYHINNKTFKGYISKESNASTYDDMLEAIYKGEEFLDPKLMKQIEVLSLNTEGIKSIEKLTKREYEIFSLLSKGLSNYEIANTLCISEKTVRNNLTSIYRKLNLKGRSEAILFFQKNQL